MILRVCSGKENFIDLNGNDNLPQSYINCITYDFYRRETKKRMALYIIESLHIMMYFLPLYVAGRIFWLHKRGGGREYPREIVLAFFSVFMLVLLTLTFKGGRECWRSESFAQAFQRFKYGNGVNLKPFHTIKNYLRHASNVDNIRVNILGNIVMFIPWGLCIPMLWKKYQSFIKVAGLSLLLPMFIEFCQLFVGRSVDVDDIILNFTGGILGGILYFIIKKMFPKIERFSS